MKVDVAQQIHDPSPSGIARVVGTLITDGHLSAGDKLPTVRELAHRLGTSPATVSAAWQQLRRAGLVHTDGRRGTVVRQPSPLEGTTRFSEIHRVNAGSLLDLSESGPDPRLLPDVRKALELLSRNQLPTSYYDPPVLPELDEVLRDQWPFEPEALTVVDGVMDAVDRLLLSLVRPGTRVLIENPTFPPILDLLELHGAEVVGLETDDEGVLPRALAEALAVRDAEVLLLQPNAQNPTGHSMGAARCRELAALLKKSKALIIEDDHSTGICRSPGQSLGKHLPERTVLIRGFSKAYGPDLRMAAVGGAEQPITALVRRRVLGPAWTSRLLQSLLLFLLTDADAIESVATAKAEYASRRRRLLTELAQRGVEARGSDGTNIWVTVRDEHEALISLVLQGLAASPGSAFLVAPVAQDHIRVACGGVASGFEELAEKLAIASTATRRRRAR